MPKTNIAGIILAGGAATRMGRKDKPLLQLGAATVLDHLLARLKPQVDAVALNANGDPQRYQDVGLPIIADAGTTLEGPLAGILATMDWAAAQGAHAVLTVSGDTPFIPADLAPRLCAAVGKSEKIAIARSNGQVHPTVGLWPISLKPKLLEFLTSQARRKVMLFIESQPHIHVDFDAEPFDPFFNINTPEDLAQAQNIAQSIP